MAARIIRRTTGKRSPSVIVYSRNANRRRGLCQASDRRRPPRFAGWRFPGLALVTRSTGDGVSQVWRPGSFRASRHFAPCRHTGQ